MSFPKTMVIFPLQKKNPTEYKELFVEFEITVKSRIKR